MNDINEIEIKTSRLCEMLAKNGLAGVLLNSQYNFAWLTGGGSNAVNLSAETGVGSLFVRRDGKRFAIANNIEIERIMTEEISTEHFTPIAVDWRDEKSVPDLLAREARKLSAGMGEPISDLPVSPGMRPAEGLVAPCRYQLTENETARYRSLGSDASEALDRVIERIVPGDSESKIADVVAEEVRRIGAAPIVVLAGADDRLNRYRHPVPTSNTWKRTLLIVLCARRAGLVANLSRLACVGPPGDVLIRNTESATRIFERACASTAVGRSGAEIYREIERAYAAEGFADEILNHHQGGATGYKSREWFAHPASGEIVHLNQAFAWNPSITGTKVEETIILGNDGIEFITSSTTKGIAVY